MTDHAKNLADALREMLVYDLNEETAPFRVRAKEALAAYDARPQVSGDLVERLQVYADAQRKNHLPLGEALIREAADALFRAPQPDTVTEDRYKIVLELLAEYLAGAPGEMSHLEATQWEIGRRHQLRRELTAALAVKAKPPSDEELAGAGGIR